MRPDHARDLPRVPLAQRTCDFLILFEAAHRSTMPSTPVQVRGPPRALQHETQHSRFDVPFIFSGGPAARYFWRC